MLRVESVSYEISKRYLLKEITFSIRKGEMVAILGANGAGKSTLMKILCREKQPTQGKVVYDGKNLNEYTAKELASKRATLYQQNAISLAFTVEEVVMMGRYGKDAEDLNKIAIFETMEICGINHLSNQSMLTLSGGEQQRVHLARVLAQVWDNKDALLLLDEPISNMDMLYQHQTLAIANALSKKGYMVVCVLHEINLAAQYADRVIILKGGRKWWDGAPEEVFTSRNIFTAFGLQTKVQTNPQTLVTQVTPNGIKFDASTFNSNLANQQRNLPLKERFLMYMDEHPTTPLWQTAQVLGVSEAELLLFGLGECVKLLRPEIEPILKCIENIGWVKSVTSNSYCITECCGVYRNFSKGNQELLFLDNDIDLRIFSDKWKIVLAVEENGKESLQFFSNEGLALHKIYLTKASNREAYSELIVRFREDKQFIPIFKKILRKHMEECRDAEVNIASFHSAWENMLDEDDFIKIIHKFQLSRLQALRLAPPNRATQISLESFHRIIAYYAATEVPLMILTSNEGCIQINTGKLSNIKQCTSYLKINYISEVRLKLSEDAVNSVWHVVKPTENGNVNSLELYDSKGELIIQFWDITLPIQLNLKDGAMY